MRLSDRMAAIAEMVTPGNPVTDVGCDHAWIPIYLTGNGIIPSAVACDLRRGPLERAEKHIREAHLEDRIRTVLCDGVPKEKLTGTLIISGMGGMLTGRILTEAAERLDGFSEFVFEPQSDLGSFRRTLETCGLRIEDEQMLQEDGKTYTVIRAVHGTSEMTQTELQFGPVLLKKKDHSLLVYLQQQETVKKKILAHLSGSDSAEAEKRMQELEEELREIAEAKERYEVRNDH